MPGPFFHLWLAGQAYPRFIEAASLARYGDNLWPHFSAGAVAPDIGFYPGGPDKFSKMVHNCGRTGTFLRTLTKEAESVEEEAFVAGWALHVFADAAIHPAVDGAAKNFYGGADKSQLMNWHMKLEWGMDAVLLESTEAGGLWQQSFLFPKRSQGDLLALSAGRVYYSEFFREDEIYNGYRAITKWVKHIPQIFLWSGHISFLTDGSAYWGDYTSVFLRQGSAGLATIMKFLGWVGAGALLSPQRDRELLAQAAQSADRAVKLFFDDYRIDFAMTGEEPFGSIYAV